ncbi:hypothetical protein SAMD00019534_103370, partial [Acytostelium subglobosum LB1]|uniref:hypothetical protein n=1 Tax=Acytostelium subglobosum LB1 TaxID=1410327 RepID=UPI00064522A2
MKVLWRCVRGREVNFRKKSTCIKRSHTHTNRMTGNYYHYTDEAGLKGIKESGQIRPSTNTQTDAAYGTGVYFTEKMPQASNSTLFVNNFDGASHDPNKLQYYVRVPASEVPDAYQVNSKRNIVLLPTDQPFDLPKSAQFGERKR